MIDYEKHYWSADTPIGFVFQLGVVMIVGFIPSLAISAEVYHVAAAATFLPLHLTLNRIVLVYFLTLAMCALSGLLASRRLRSADPAEIFN
jgi:putative ABC transport system permease protein